jgi:hypothetical protein
VSFTISQRISRHVLEDPVTGQVVDAGVGSCLRVSFRRGLGTSRWRVADRPSYLVPLEEGDHDFSFLVFEPSGSEPGPADRTLRLVRQRVDRPDTAEVRCLTVTVSA